MNNAAIGVFDSGVGGLTCVKELVRLMPNENIVYLGDTARVPYGSKSKELIAQYGRQDIKFLEQHNVKMVLVACGTVSSVLMTTPIFEGTSITEFSGVIYPAVHAACAATHNNRIGVIGTTATIRSGCYGKAIHEMKPDIKVVGKACPLFVPLVENGYTSPDNRVSTLVAQEYLEVMIKEKVDTLILGCTHYPMLKDIIAGVMGDGGRLISSGAEVAKHAQKILAYNDALSDRKEEGTLELYCTDSVELFAENVDTFLGNNKNITISKCNLAL